MMDTDYQVYSFMRRTNIETADCSKDGNFLCVGGSSQLAIMKHSQLESGEFQFQIEKELQSKQKGVVNHVSWCHSDSDNKIVSSYSTFNTQGQAQPISFIVWDTNTGQKIHSIVKDSPQNVNKIHWNPKDPNLLVSTSTSGDNEVKIWDLRLGKSVNKLQLSENPRDVRFYPHNPELIISVQNNCFIEMHSLKKGPQPVRSIFKHTKTVNCLDFHPENPTIFASGGQEHKVILWHIDEKEEFVELSSYNHIAIVGIVKWASRTELVVGSFSMFNELMLVDFQHPQRPYRVFQGHPEVVSSVMVTQTSKRLISCSKDGLILSRSIYNGYEPYDHMKKSLVTVDPNNNIGFYYSNFIPGKKSTPSPESISNLTKYFINQTSKNESTKPPPYVGILQNFGELSNSREELEYFATNYKIRTIPDLREKAETNSKVAEKREKTLIAQLWLEFANIFCSKSNQENANKLNSKGNGESSIPELPKKDSSIKFEAKLQFNQRGESQVDEAKFSGAAENHREEIDAEMIYKYFENDQDGLLQAINNEDFVQQNGNTLYISQFLKEQILHSFTMEEKVQIEGNNIHPTVLKSCIHSLQELVDMGELQSALTFAIVFDDYLQIDHNLKQCWCVDLVEMLRSFRLYTQANYYHLLVNKEQNMIQKNKVFNRICTCGKAIFGNKCEACHKVVKCSFCKMPVKGLMLWCQCCSHGGHFKHLQKWFEKETQCPTGCGHNCFSSLQPSMGQ